MFEQIESFKVDHENLLPGLYERSTIDNIKTWDVRFKRPNCGDYLTQNTIHTLEHYMAIYLKNVLKHSVYAVFPMGCATGFYILTRKHTTRRTMLLGLLGVHAYLNSEDNIPGADPVSCGNYESHSLIGARDAMEEFYNNCLIGAELEVYEDLLKPIEEEGVEDI